MTEMARSVGKAGRSGSVPKTNVSAVATPMVLPWRGQHLSSGAGLRLSPFRGPKARRPSMPYEWLPARLR